MHMGMGAGPQKMISRGFADGYLAKLSVEGSILWASQMGGPNADSVTDVKTDAQGNPVVAGYFFRNLDIFSANGNLVANRLNPEDTYELFMVKFDPAGQVVWSTTTQSDSSDFPSEWKPSLAMDAQDSAFVAATFKEGVRCDAAAPDGPAATSHGRHDVFLSKVSAAGTTEWCQSFGGAQDDRAFAVATDPIGDVLVVGQFEAQATFGTFVLTTQGVRAGFYAKVAGATGEVLWVRALDGGPGAKVAVKAVAIGPNNLAVVAASFTGRASVPMAGGSTRVLTTADDNDVAVLQLDESGLAKWVLRLGASGHDDPQTDARAFAAVVDADNHAILALPFLGELTLGPNRKLTSRNYNGYVLKVGPEGSPAWALPVVSRYAAHAASLALCSNHTRVLAVGDFERAAVAGDAVALASVEPACQVNLCTDAFVLNLASRIPEDWTFQTLASPPPPSPPPPPAGSDPQSFVVSVAFEFAAGVELVNENFERTFVGTLASSVAGDAEVVLVDEVTVKLRTVLVKCRVVFPPEVSMADGFQCLPASRNECGKLLRTLTNDDAYSLFRSRALFRGVDVLVHENLVLTTHNGDSAEWDVQEQPAAPSAGDRWWEYALISFAAGVVAWGACVAMDRLNPGMHHGIMLLTLVSTLSFVGNVTYLATDLAPDASVQSHFAAALALLLLYTAFNGMVLTVTVLRFLKKDSYFKQWFFSNPFWAAVVIVLAIPNVEVVALCSCHLLAQFHAVWDESPHTEHMLATMGLISLLEDIPQMILLVTSNQERGKWSEAAWFSMVMMSLSISYSLTMRMLFAVHVFRRRAKNLIPNKSLQYQVNAQSIPHQRAPAAAPRTVNQDTNNDISSAFNPVFGDAPRAAESYSSQIVQAPALRDIFTPSSRGMS